METLPLATVKAKLSEIVDRVHDQQDRVVITRHGVPTAVLLSVEDLASLEETLDVLGDPDAVHAIRQAQDEYARGDFFTLDEVRKELEERRARARA